MSPGRNRTSDPADDVYEIDLGDDSPEDALRDAVEAAEAASAAAGGSATTSAPTDDPDGFAAMREKYLRALADFDNYRKRVERERAETARTALAEPLRGFLGVVDNLDRALSAGGSSEDLKAGVQMILRQTGDLLRRFGVEQVSALGEPFDPAFHEAVSTEPAETEAEDHLIAKVFQAGYVFRGQLLRPARVVVRQWLG